VPVLSLGPLSMDAATSSPSLRFHTDIVFHALPFGRCALSMRPSMSRMPVSSDEGVVMVMICKRSPSGTSSAEFGQRTRDWGRY
jgi:hypothetical protein